MVITNQEKMRLTNATKQPKDEDIKCLPSRMVDGVLRVIMLKRRLTNMDNLEIAKMMARVVHGPIMSITLEVTHVHVALQ